MRFQLSDAGDDAVSVSLICPKEPVVGCASGVCFLYHVTK